MSVHRYPPSAIESCAPKNLPSGILASHRTQDDHRKCRRIFQGVGTLPLDDALSQAYQKWPGNRERHNKLMTTCSVGFIRSVKPFQQHAEHNKNLGYGLRIRCHGICQENISELLSLWFRDPARCTSEHSSEQSYDAVSVTGPENSSRPWQSGCEQNSENDEE